MLPMTARLGNSHAAGQCGPMAAITALGVSLALASVTASAGDRAPPRRHEFTQAHMGVPIKIVLYADDEAAANRAAEAAFQRIAALDRVMSDYDPQSELSRLSRSAGSGQAMPLGDDLWRVLCRAQALAEQTGGAFDITVGPVVRLWRRARRMQEMPRRELIEAARAAVGFRHLELDPMRQTATLRRPGMRLDLGGIAMGDAVDQALAVLAQHGIRSALIDASGDIAASGPPPGELGWRVAIAPRGGQREPRLWLSLAQGAVAVSGDVFQQVEIDGVRYSHIVDPRTGLGLTSRIAVTVIAADCLTADSLATAVSVLGPDAGLKLVDQTPGAAALVVQETDGTLQQFASRRWSDAPWLEAPRP
jgi:thiamine biosynthesis lipoprotein